MSKDDDAFTRGLEVFEQVYGPGSSAMMRNSRDVPLIADTVEHLFAEIWSRPHLSIRERRLLVIGATAMLGRPDLIEIQVRGAIANGEFTDAQLEEIALQLAPYAGAGNATALWRGIQAAKTSRETEG